MLQKYLQSLYTTNTLLSDNNTILSKIKVRLEIKIFKTHSNKDIYSA